MMYIAHLKTPKGYRDLQLGETIPSNALYNACCLGIWEPVTEDLIGNILQEGWVKFCIPEHTKNKHIISID